jgi:hypothetical protein
MMTMSAGVDQMLGMVTSRTSAPSPRKVCMADSKASATSGFTSWKKKSRGTPMRSPRTPPASPAA